jgi:hypothetical protein
MLQRIAPSLAWVNHEAGVGASEELSTGRAVLDAQQQTGDKEIDDGSTISVDRGQTAEE